MHAGLLGLGVGISVCVCAAPIPTLLQSQRLLLPNPLRLLSGPPYSPSTHPIPRCPCPWTPLMPPALGPLSTVEDLERNDGTPERPYFMSLTLKKILNKTNKRQAEA